MQPTPPIRLSWKFDVLGAVFIALLGFVTWQLTHPFSWVALLPLAVIGYVAFRIVYELTWNRGRVPTLPSGRIARIKVTEALKKAIAQHTGDAHFTVVDLGSGRGGLGQHLARALPNAKIIGVELAFWPYMQSVWIQRLIGPKNLSFTRTDFGLFDCSRIDAVVMYLGGIVSKQVGEKLAQELKPGATIVSIKFPLLGSWQPVETISYHVPVKQDVFVYKK